MLSRYASTSGGCFESGLTLAEVLVVVAILGIVAVAAVPNFSSMDEQRVELAATEVADALRFARAEAMRTGTPHGLRASATEERAQVYRLDLAAPSPAPEYSVRHPGSKRLYDLRLDRAPYGADVADVGIYYDGSPVAVDYLAFDANGVPRFAADAVSHTLGQAEISVRRGDASRVVAVEPVSGRVTVR